MRGTLWHSLPGLKWCALIGPWKDTESSLHRQSSLRSTHLGQNVYCYFIQPRPILKWPAVLICSKLSGAVGKELLQHNFWAQKLLGGSLKFFNT